MTDPRDSIIEEQREIIRREAFEEAAKIAESHRGDAERDRKARGIKWRDMTETMAEIVAAEERGEDRASLLIAGLLRSRSPDIGRADREKGGNEAERVCFYEREFYPLSNFSAFRLKWKGFDFDTSEAAYHWEKFPECAELRDTIRFAKSAHVAFKTAEKYVAMRRPDWNDVRVSIMKAILIEKALQHEYVRRKLLETGDRELVEDSWRDDFWGWGPNRDGQNMLGKLWMEVRAELRRSPPPLASGPSPIEPMGKEGSS